MGRKRIGAQKLMPSSATGLNGQRGMIDWHMGKKQNGSWANSKAQKSMACYERGFKGKHSLAYGQEMKSWANSMAQKSLRTSSAMELWELAWHAAIDALREIYNHIRAALYIYYYKCIWSTAERSSNSCCLMRALKWDIAIPTIVSWWLSGYKMLCVDGVREEWESI